VYFTVDATPPAISFLSLEDKTYDTSDVPLSFTVSEATFIITYSLDGQENVTVVGNTTLSGLSIGKHNLTVYATDMYGNTAAETITFSVADPFPITLVIAPSHQLQLSAWVCYST
jgi:hypothetical protein